ncbi:hypothetical protein ACIRPX_34440 [Streptomyces sp. NPDC101225]|uniref:hypothetical protein n=1 Tax=Streptomyces sp. NPDC101225 TaxID=3366135 RepID=UPI003801D87F
MTSGSRAPWGRCVGYGLLSGTLVLLLLGLVLSLLPVGDGGAALLMYVALVFPPALAAHRFAPGGRRTGSLGPHPSPKPALPGPLRPTAAEAADRAITSYGELLRLHTYRPGPCADPDDLAAYRTAVETYDEAGASAPARVPELLERGRTALERLDTARRAGTDIVWTRGTGGTRVRVPRPAEGGPALLVFETDNASGSFSVRDRGGAGGRPRVLLKGAFEPSRTAPGRARVLLPEQHGTEMFLDVGATGPWRIALRPPGEARRLEAGAPLTGRGIETVLKDDGCRAVEFEHHGTGAFALREVTRTYRPGRLLADGRGRARLTVAVPDARRVLRVQATGRWTLHPAA